MADALEYAKNRYPLAVHYLFTYFDIGLEMPVKQMVERYTDGIAQSARYELLKHQIRQLLSDSNIDWVALTTTDPDYEVFGCDDTISEAANQDAARAYVKEVLWDSLH